MTTKNKAPTRDFAYLIAAVVAAWCTWYFFIGMSEKAQNANINPAVFAAFRSIEARCIAEPWPHQTVRCKQALDLMRACAARDPSCRANDYYDELTSYGFDLPALYSAIDP